MKRQQRNVCIEVSCNKWFCWWNMIYINSADVEMVEQDYSEHFQNSHKRGLMDVVMRVKEYEIDEKSVK